MAAEYVEPLERDMKNLVMWLHNQNLRNDANSDLDQIFSVFDSEAGCASCCLKASQCLFLAVCAAH